MLVVATTVRVLHRLYRRNKTQITLFRRSLNQSQHLHSWQLHGLLANSFSSLCTCGRPDLPLAWACQSDPHLQPHPLVLGRLTKETGEKETSLRKGSAQHEGS